jgi:hypothetical protein
MKQEVDCAAPALCPAGQSPLEERKGGKQENVCQTNSAAPFKTKEKYTNASTAQKNRTKQSVQTMMFSCRQHNFDNPVHREVR